ncbi:sulfatase family protein [Rodentibacter pneumotropicus]|uniref:Sulfatase family protein n=1 Tax=Rodentibacter pneumotropicus TaxID=758 RepID=A0A448MKT4_9PAST|nr:sulfatase family protein [Rodentibacter pneumotropicus]
MTARSFLEKHGLLDGEQYAQTLEQEGRLDALKISYPKHPLVFTPMGQKPNILFITVSGLRYDAISAETMPKLAEFAANSTKFTNHYSSGNTKNSGLVGLFYGLNANYTDSILSNHTSSVFIEKLKAEKYQFGLFSVTNFKESLFRQALFRGMKLPKGKSSNESAVKNFNEFIATQNRITLGLLISILI